MARPCSICSRPDRAEIDAALVGPESFRGVSRRFAVSPDAMERHAKAHLPKALAKAKGAADEAYGDSLAEKVRALETHADRLRARAEKDQDIRASLAAIKVLSELVKLLHETQATQAAAGPQKILIEYVDGKDWRSFGRPEIEVIERKAEDEPGN